MQAILALCQAEATAARGDVQAMIQEDLQHLFQAQRARLAIHERHRVDREGILQRRALVELLEHGLRNEAVLHLDDQAQAVDAVSEFWTDEMPLRRPAFAFSLIFSMTFSGPTM